MIKLIRQRVYKVGYVAKVEEFSGDDCPWEGTESQTITSAYTPEGLFIGTTSLANLLCKKHGIKPELADPSENICSIGFSAIDKKWYGWSNRALCGFQIGDEVVYEDSTNLSGWTDEHLKKYPKDDRSLPVGFKAKTLKDCRRMAIAFADFVG